MAESSPTQADLSQRLREFIAALRKTPWEDHPLLCEAADALDQAAARIAELERQLAEAEGLLREWIDYKFFEGIAERTKQFLSRTDPAADVPAEQELKTGCEDCGRPYGNEHGFPDLIIPNHVWREISTNHDTGGLLCPSCICARLAKAGKSQVYGAFMSGPIQSVSEPTMHTFRWMENLREQGHGWYCPACNGAREQDVPAEQGGGNG